MELLLLICKLIGRSLAKEQSRLGLQYFIQATYSAGISAPQITIRSYISLKPCSRRDQERAQLFGSYFEVLPF